jgi:hypothetical protein
VHLNRPNRTLQTDLWQNFSLALNFIGDCMRVATHISSASSPNSLYFMHALSASTLGRNCVIRCLCYTAGHLDSWWSWTGDISFLMLGHWFIFHRSIRPIIDRMHIYTWIIDDIYTKYRLLTVIYNLWYILHVSDDQHSDVRVWTVALTIYCHKIVEYLRLSWRTYLLRLLWKNKMNITACY